MGWIVAIGIAGAAWLLLWRVVRVPRIAREAVGATLVLALAGYALSGVPGQPGAPATRSAARPQVDERAIELRQAMSGGFGQAYNWMIASDGAMRAGLPSAAVTYIRSGIREDPRNADLWLGLGNALVARADNNLTPAAKFAYERAAILDPRHPGPWFFLGLAYARAGEPERARPLWLQALRRAPADAEYRPVLEAAYALASSGAPMPR